MDSIVKPLSYFRDGCCQVWCRCFLGYSYMEDCGEGRVYNEEKQACVELWQEPDCQVSTTTTTEFTKPNECQAGMSTKQFV